MFAVNDFQRAISLTRIILSYNEVGNNSDLVYQFSDPDGVRTGRSGWSFGNSQFDINNNSRAQKILLECGFTETEIFLLEKQDRRLDMSTMNAKLLLNAEIINRADRDHVLDSISHCISILLKDLIPLETDEVFYHIVDYHNQFHFSNEGKLHRWLRELGRVITVDDIYDFKMNNTLWGSSRPDDVRRRFNNIQNIFKGA